MVTTRSKSSKVKADASGIIPDSPIASDSSCKGASDSKKGKSSFTGNYAQLIIFLSLVLDLLAFTIILPLFPSLLHYYKTHDGPNGAYRYFEDKIEYFQRLLGAPSKHNELLFGGFLGSLFSFLQFVASPIVGALSDVYGRKPVILLCLVGITCSYYLWSVSTTFLIFILARIVGGISKGNLSCSMAAMTDVSSSDKRASGMALIGAAFSVAFTLGPMIGAFYAKSWKSGDGVWFAKPALLGMALSIADIIFVIALFRETLPKEKRLKSVASSLRQAFTYINVKDLFLFNPVKNMTAKDLKQLRSLGLVYFLYLFIYSGLEFTLTFLTHYKFQYTPMQQGWMLSLSGVIMTITQGLFVRRIPSESVQTYASVGLLIIVPAFLCVGMAETQTVFYVGIVIYSLSTSLVVPCMMTMASKYGTSSQKGTALGIIRSLGALARATGPIVGCIGYWCLGSLITYCAGGVLLLIPWYLLKLSPNMKV